MKRIYDLKKNANTSEFTGYKSVNCDFSQNSDTKLFEILVNRNRLAELISIAPSTISKMMVEEGLPYYKIGKSCRFKVAEVMAFLEERKRP